MNTLSKISIAVAIIISVSVGYVAFSGRNHNAVTQMQSESQPKNETKVANTKEGGKYVEYTPQSLAEASGTKLLFFHAPWCPQCRALETDIQQYGVPDGVTILKVDYDTNQKLRQKYGVSIQTTIVKIDDAGNLVEKYVAYQEPTVHALAKELL